MNFSTEHLFVFHSGAGLFGWCEIDRVDFH